MKKHYHVMNQFNCYVSNIIFNILSIFVINITYNFGFLGTKTEDFFEILIQFVVDTFLNPIALLFSGTIIILLIIEYIKHFKDKFNLKKTISCELTLLRLLFIPIIIVLNIAIAYLYMNIDGSAWLCAFILVFSNMFVFEYIYVMWLYQIVDSIFSHN